MLPACTCGLDLPLEQSGRVGLAAADAAVRLVRRGWRVWRCGTRTAGSTGWSSRGSGRPPPGVGRPGGPPRALRAGGEALVSPPGLSKSLSSRGVAVAGDALVLLALLAVAPAAAARPRVPGGGGAPLAPPGGGAVPGKALARGVRVAVLATGCVAVDEPRGPRGAFIAEWTALRDCGRETFWSAVVTSTSNRNDLQVETPSLSAPCPRLSSVQRPLLQNNRLTSSSHSRTLMYRR